MFPLCIWKNSSDTHFTDHAFFVWYFASCVAHLQQSPTNSLLYAGRRQLSAAQRKVFEIFLHPATAWRSNVCHSAGLLPGIRHAVFPGKTLQLSFQLALPEPLPPRFLRGTLGKSQPGHELDGKGWREGEAGEESRQNVVVKDNVGSVSSLGRLKQPICSAFLFLAVGSVSKITMF